VIDGFDVVPGRVEDVGAVVPGVVVALARGAVVLSTRGYGRGVELRHRFLPVGLEREVEILSGRAVGRDEELVRLEVAAASRT